MSVKKTYLILVIFVLGVLIMYFFNKYKVAPKIDLSKIEVVNPDSTIFDFKALRGEKVIISFYASWCGNCLDELKVLNSIKNDKLQDVKVLAITDESIEKLMSFKDKKQYPFTFLKLKQSFSDIGIFSIPTVYLLNTKGEVVYQKVGYIDWKDESTLNHLKIIME